MSPTRMQNVNQIRVHGKTKFREKSSYQRRRRLQRLQRRLCLSPRAPFRLCRCCSLLKLSASIYGSSKVLEALPPRAPSGAMCYGLGQRLRECPMSNLARMTQRHTLFWRQRGGNKTNDAAAAALFRGYSTRT